MRVAGQKTQVLVLSQSSRDAVNCTLKVAGETVVAGDRLKLLGPPWIGSYTSSPTAAPYDECVHGCATSGS